MINNVNDEIDHDDFDPDDDFENELMEDSEKEDFSENCREDVKNSFSKQEREEMGNELGPNWANIIAGLGDQ